MDLQPTQPADESVEQDAAAASPSPQESESNWMNNAIRSVAGWFGRDDEASEDTQEQAETAPPEATQTGPTEAEIQDRIRREAQSLKDRELYRERREWAKDRADQGDLVPIRQLAEKGDRWAQSQLAESGDTWALGEIKQAEIKQAAQSEDVGAQITGIGAHFDQAYLEPLLAAHPDQDEANRLRAATVGLEGRAQTTQATIKAIQRHAAQEAATRLLSDETFARSALKDTAFRRALLSDPVMRKQLNAYFRNDLDEPDLNPGTGPGRGGERESDVMNDALRNAWRGAEYRSDTERAAGAGAPNGRGANRDLLDDDA